MSYIEGFVIPVAEGQREAFLDHARRIDAIFIELGATRVVECWGDDVPSGSVTDFRRAVAAEDDESVIFSWIEWPDKATRDAAHPKIPSDPRMAGPIPFDGKRMIFGGFVPVFELGK